MRLPWDLSKLTKRFPRAFILNCARLSQPRRDDLAWQFLSYNTVMIPQDLLEILVCPVCKKPLVLKTNPEALKCDTCHRVYPVRDDIPILLVDQATTDPS